MSQPRHVDPYRIYVPAHPKPFSQSITEEQIPTHFMVPKVTPFTGLEDPKSYLKAFRAHMFISGGSDVIQCKMFLGTFTEIALQWFGRISHKTINAFQVFSQMFLEQFKANKLKPPRIVDLFTIKQQESELLKLFEQFL